LNNTNEFIRPIEFHSTMTNAIPISEFANLP